MLNEKILFWIDIEFLYFFIAKKLSEKENFDLYAIFDVNNKAKEFFESQKLVDFKKRWYFLDNVELTDEKLDLKFLENFEDKYNLHLWDRAFSEKSFYKFNEYHDFSDNEILELIEKECKFFENVLDEIKPDFVIIKKTDWHHNQLFYEICRARGIRVLMTIPTRLGFRVVISQRADKLDITTNNSSNITDFEDVEKVLQKYNSFEQVKKFRKNFQIYNWNKFFTTLRFFLNPLDNSYQKRYSNYKRTRSKILYHGILNSIKSKSRERFIEKVALKEIENIPFVYYPLHFEPERTLLVDAPFYTNQLEVITYIAKSIPIDYKLYVKEHPIMKLKGWREIEYYKFISNLPNTELVHPSVNPQEIYKKCKLVLTATGTSGFEAAFFEKPAIIFSDVIYSEIPSVYRLENVENLQQLIKKAIKTPINKNELRDFLQKLESSSFEMDINKMNTDFSKLCYYGGFLVDEKISKEKIIKFLQNNEKIFDVLADEHLKKIKQFKENKILEE